ncbi:MAG: BlaI/MecI/CopY family transcriptional regulator [Saccharofermentanales bacterium]
MSRSSIPHLSEREMEIMQFLWDHGESSAADIASFFLKTNKQLRNTTYTFLSRLIDKGVIKREDPGFTCSPLFERYEMQFNEAQSFLKKVYDGSFRDMFAQFVSMQDLTKQEIEELKKLISEKKDGV